MSSCLPAGPPTRSGAGAVGAAEVAQPAAASIATCLGPVSPMKSSAALPPPPPAPPLSPQMYAPKFFDRAEKTGGREWDSVREGRIWRLSHRYLRTRQYREAPLDPAKQYIVNYHPHGVLVLSRTFFYGACPASFARCSGARRVKLPGGRAFLPGSDGTAAAAAGGAWEKLFPGVKCRVLAATVRPSSLPAEP